ncbi:MAG TPA: ATP synthase F1 subunit epsilon [Longimicrobiaceae bacterium]|nr:ATP synthase F1 subunit epsilon [Longimicrobiaceae bacterium]
MAALAAGAGGAAGALRVSVLSPEQAVYEGEATHVVAPALDGKLGILRGHAPLMALLGEGILRIDTGRESVQFHVAGGFLQVVDNVVTVLSEHAAAA